MNQLFIPQYKLVEETSVKSHYVYVVEILHAGKRHTIEKRYSAFHSLHRELRKNFTTPLFPPKRVRNTNPKVLETRRLGLERYLQEMLKYSPTRKRVLSFFGLQPLPAESSDSLADIDQQLEHGDEEGEEERKPLEHQPIFTFQQDLYLTTNESAKFPDILSAGVISAMYGDGL